jgi:hypothetical protein
MLNVYEASPYIQMAAEVVNRSLAFLSKKH